jgi:hypothetical protein
MSRDQKQRLESWCDYYKRVRLYIDGEEAKWARDNLAVACGLGIFIVLALYLLYRTAPDTQTLAATCWVFGVSLILFIVAVFVRAPWKLDQIRVHEIETLNQELNEEREKQKTARPKIILKEPNAFYVEQVAQLQGDGNTRFAPFLKVRFINEPEKAEPSAVANEVIAKLKYFRCNESGEYEEFLSLDGRWSESDQPSSLSPLVSKSHLLRSTFGISEEHSLDIAYRNSQNGIHYAWNNDNYKYAGGRYERHQLTGSGCFKVEICLKGPWVDELFMFPFRIAQWGFDITQSAV